jgi:hypothetical protein
MLYHYNENYVVNEHGECFSLFHGRLRKLTPYINGNGYVMYRIRVDKKTIHKPAHHLSYWVNIGHFDTSDGLQIDHIDGNKLNNHYTNLRRITRKDNANNINTVGVLTKWSRSDYRIYDNDKLPSAYTKSEKFDSTKSIGKNLVYIGGKWVRRNYCPICGGVYSGKGKVCIKCYRSQKASMVPSREELIADLMSRQPITTLSSSYGISGTAYRKWLIKRGLPSKLSDIKEFLSHH